MATSLAEIRARLQAQDNKQQRTGGDSAIYAHWNIPEGTSARVRYLPDADPSNPFFWIERLMIRLPFAGIKGLAESKPVTVNVPCMEMWGETCPILAEVRPWFKDPNLEELGRKYWKKKSYLFQGFVHENPLSTDEAPENPIRRFVISSQIYNIVKTSLMDPEMENMPTDYENGLDFIIKKTSKGGYSDYSTSAWARKESALTAAELQAIETYGLYNLRDFLPKKPGEVELKVIKEMFEASVDGQPYDPDLWANYFKPPGLQVGTGSTGDDDATAAKAVKPAATKPAVTKPAVAKVQESDDAQDDDSGTTEAAAPVTADKATSSKRAEDILAMIRNRQK
jgi:hypothetical protein